MPASISKILLLFAVLPLGVGRSDQPSKPMRYERFVSPPTQNPAERQLLRVVARWGDAHGKTLRYDARLARASRRMLPHAAAVGAVNLDLARQYAQRLGWTDGELVAVTVRDAERLSEGLLKQLDGHLTGVEVNRFGLGVAESRVVLLMSRHLVNLMPLRQRIASGSRPVIAGSLGRDLRRQGTSAELVVTTPAGSTHRWPLALHQDHFRQRLPQVRQRGVGRAQILVSRGRGPEVAVSLNLGYDGPAWPGLSRLGPEAVEEARWVAPAAVTLGDEDVEAQLGRLVIAVRASQGLALPAQSTRLARVARSHARDMRDNHFFAHVSPSTGDLTDRLTADAITYVRAIENIAKASSVQDVVDAWMRSPSHRANLMDEVCTTMGVGVVAAGGTLYAVLVLTRLADDGGTVELAAQASRGLQESRAQSGNGNLIVDPRLTEIAATHSTEMAELGRMSDVSPTRGSLVDAVFRQMDVQEAAADVFVANSVDVVLRSKHLRGEFTRVGVGVHRSPHNDGRPRLWVTVIYAR